jgi:ribosome-binding ATPase YchF (GTP1/OBG family)
MKHEISLETLVMARRALEELTQWYLERVVKDLEEFNRTANMRKRAFTAASQIEMATYALLSITKLEVTNGAKN